MEREPSEALSHTIAATRKQLLDVIELAFGDSPKWPVVRSRVLDLLGESGLEGALVLKKPLGLADE